MKPLRDGSNERWVGFCVFLDFKNTPLRPLKVVSLSGRRRQVHLLPFEQSISLLMGLERHDLRVELHLMMLHLLRFGMGLPRRVFSHHALRTVCTRQTSENAHIGGRRILNVTNLNTLKL